MKGILRFLVKHKLVPACIFIFVLTTIIDTSFLGKFNLNSLLIDISIIGILTLGQMLVILTGGIDLSIGNIASATSVFLASMMIAMQALPPSVNMIISVTLINLAFGPLLSTKRRAANADDLISLFDRRAFLEQAVYSQSQLLARLLYRISFGNDPLAVRNDGHGHPVLGHRTEYVISDVWHVY